MAVIAHTACLTSSKTLCTTCVFLMGQETDKELTNGTPEFPTPSPLKSVIGFGHNVAGLPFRLGYVSLTPCCW